MSDATYVDHLIGRLESLSVTMAALSMSGRNVSVETMLETLDRMDRRDRKVLSVIEAFASALEAIDRRLSRIEQSAGTPPALPALDSILARLESDDGDTAATAVLERIAGRLDTLEQAVAHPPKLPEPIKPELLESIDRRLSKVEKRTVSKTSGKSVASILEGIEQRLAQMDEKMAQLPAPAAAAKTPKLQLRTTVIDRLTAAAAGREEKQSQASAVPQLPPPAPTPPPVATADSPAELLLEKVFQALSH
ncbi:MAG: hypothetical protein HY985_03920 [Magnetospirillum sp.]|nr:hypothetical protein [Magnetospirillum sp.]